MLTFRNPLLYGCGSPSWEWIDHRYHFANGQMQDGKGSGCVLLVHGEEEESAILECFKQEVVVHLPTPLPRDGVAGGLRLDSRHASVQEAPWPGRARRAFIMSLPACLHPHCLPTRLPCPQALLNPATAETWFVTPGRGPSKNRTAFMVRQTRFEFSLPHLPAV